MKPNLDELERVALAAQAEAPGPYFFAYSRIISKPTSDEYMRIERTHPDAMDDDDPRWKELPEPDVCWVEAKHGDTASTRGSIIANYLAAADPKTVLALVQRVRELERAAFRIISVPGQLDNIEVLLDEARAKGIDTIRFAKYAHVEIGPEEVARARAELERHTVKQPRLKHALKEVRARELGSITTIALEVNGQRFTLPVTTERDFHGLPMGTYKWTDLQLDAPGRPRVYMLNAAGEVVVEVYETEPVPVLTTGTSFMLRCYGDNFYE